jgi:hypothetical protein
MLALAQGACSISLLWLCLCHCGCSHRLSTPQWQKGEGLVTVFSASLYGGYPNEVRPQVLFFSRVCLSRFCPRSSSFLPTTRSFPPSFPTRQLLHPYNLRMCPSFSLSLPLTTRAVWWSGCDHHAERGPGHHVVPLLRGVSRPCWRPSCRPLSNVLGVRVDVTSDFVWRLCVVRLAALTPLPRAFGCRTAADSVSQSTRSEMQRQHYMDMLRVRDASGVLFCACCGCMSMPCSFDAYVPWGLRAYSDGRCCAGTSVQLQEQTVPVVLNHRQCWARLCECLQHISVFVSGQLDVCGVVPRCVACVVCVLWSPMLLLTLCCAVLCCAVLCCAVLCCAVLCCAVLCCR